MVDAADESKQENTPEPRRVALRALALAALTCRGLIDHGAGNPDAESVHKRLVDWIGRVGLADELEPDEQAAIDAPLGQLAEQQAIRLGWHTEGLAILAWALQLYSVPPFFQQVDPYHVTDAVEFLAETAAEIVSNAALRPAIERNALREIYYAIHCRLRNYRHNPNPKDIRDWFESWWFELTATSSPLGSDGDLEIDGRSFTMLPESRRAECGTIIWERHRALIWLSGNEGPNYSQTTVDT